MSFLNRSSVFVVVVACVMQPHCANSQSASGLESVSSRERLSLDRGWLFHLAMFRFP